MDKLEVGDFITYKGMHMAIVAENTDKNKLYALCFENHKLATFEIGDSNAKLWKHKGCKSLVKAIYDDIDYKLNYGGES